MRRWLMFAALGMLWSTFAGPVLADELVGAAGYYTGWVAGDLALTKYAKDHGAFERNYKSALHATLGSVALVTALTAADQWLAKRDKKAQKLLRIGAGVGFGGLMVNSAINAHKAKR